MRSLKSGLLSVIFTGFCGLAAVVGCSAEGASDVIEDTNPTDPETDGTQLPPSNPGTSSSGSSSGSTTDAGAKKDAAPKDAGPPPPEPGDPCTKLNEIFERSCGACGKQEAVCLEGGDGGGGTVTEYGACEKEVEDGCIPGTTEDVACGNCGTAKKTCNKYCAWSTSACGGQPANSCAPGAIEYTTAGCAVNGYRNRTCGAACTWSGFSTACSEPIHANKMTISPTVGGVVSQQWTFSPSNTGKRVTGTCSGSPNVSTTENHQQVLVEVTNPTNKAATISAYHSKAAGGTELDTLIWGYSKTLPPADDNTLKSCDFGVEDSCDVVGKPCGGTSSLNLAGMEKVTIPANGKILVMSAGYSSSVTGPFVLNLRTDAL